MARRGRRTAQIVLSEQERETLERWRAGPRAPRQRATARGPGRRRGRGRDPPRPARVSRTVRVPLCPVRAPGGPHHRAQRPGLSRPGWPVRRRAPRRRGASPGPVHRDPPDSGYHRARSRGVAARAAVGDLRVLGRPWQSARLPSSRPITRSPTATLMASAGSLSSPSCYVDPLNLLAQAGGGDSVQAESPP